MYQSADKNSGIWGGKFLERKKHNHKSEDRYLVDTDFQIGSVVQLSVYNFQLLKADDFTLQYMKERPNKFPEVNVESPLGKIKALASSHASYDDFLIWFIKNVDPAGKQSLSYDDFSKNLSKIVKLTSPELYALYKTSIEKEKLSMKKLFKVLGGA